MWPCGRPGRRRGAEASLFAVRRELHFRFDRDDLRLHQAQLVVSYVQAGPGAAPPGMLSCPLC
ncbi:hypothetical protein SVIOM74S_00514 [Streptomyces violarus]